MSKNKALEKWLVSETGYRRTMRHSPRVVDDAEAVARAAWHAAVKHTLAHVAEKLGQQQSSGSFSEWCMQDVMGLVVRMKP